MPTFEFTAPDGKTYEVQGPDGATQEQAFSMLQSQIAAGSPPATKEPSAAFSAGRTLNDIPRQLGLTARYGLEGLANTAQIVTEPLRYLTDRATGMTGKTRPLGAEASLLADRIGLPSPQTANERVIGDASRLVAGAGGMAASAGAASRLPGAIGSVMEGLAANPTAQLTSAAGAGLAGGASREAGGSPLAQGAASLVGGVAGGLAPGGAQTLVDAGRRMLTPKPTQQQIDVTITTMLQNQGIDFASMAPAVKAAMRRDVAGAMRLGPMDEAAMARLADIRASGMTPTRGMVSLNPIDITREKNTAKIAANMAGNDENLQRLPMLQNTNNAAAIARMNDLGAGRGVLPLQAGETVTGAVRGTAAANRAAEQAAWDAAKGSPGYKQPIYPDGLNAAIRNAGDEGLVGFLPKQITDYMAAFQTGQQPFTPQHYANLRSMLSAELANGGNGARAARAAINGLDSAPMRPITNPGGMDFGTAPVTQGMANAMRSRDAQAGSAIGLINQARGATRSAYEYEGGRLPSAVLAGGRSSDPERIAQSFIFSPSSTVNDMRSVLREVGPQGTQTIKDAVAMQIKNAAVGGKDDDIAQVSQRLNTVIKQIGDEKLRLLFNPEELQQLHQLRRATGYSLTQPSGSAVNNSNSGALMAGKLADWAAKWSDKIPVVGPLAAVPVTNLIQTGRASMGTKDAFNVLPGLLAEQPKRPLAPSLLLPGLAVGGGLLSQ